MNDVIYGGITVADLLGILGGGLGVSIVAEVLKKVFKLDSAKVIQFLVVALSFVATGLAYIISAVHGNPKVLGSHTVEILGAANAFHTFIVSDASTFLDKVKAGLNDENAKTQPVATVAAEQAPVAAPTPDAEF
jgi:hypothetical protein